MIIVKKYITYFYILLLLGFFSYLRYRGNIQVKLGAGFQGGTGTYIGNYQFTGFLSGIDTDLWVSPYNAGPKVKELFNDAKYSIYGQRYLISSDEIKEILRKKSMLGVDIRLMLESSVFGNNTTAFQKFRQSIQGTNIQIKTDRDIGVNFLHVKAGVIDNAVAYISTSNLTHSSFYKNREYMIVTKNTGIVQSLNTVIDKDRHAIKLSPTIIHPNLSVCPIDCREKLEHLIGSAKDSLIIQTQYIQDSRIFEKLLAARTRGVNIRIIVSNGQEKGRVDRLSDNVRIQQEPYVHAKAILVDDMWLQIGSHNFSTNALDNNREIAIVSDDTSSIKIFKEQFEKDRQGAKKYDEKWLKE